MSDARECLICGQALEYLQEQQEMVCSFCGKTFLSNTKCRDGHYICDACHEKKGLEEVMHICGGSESKNPLEILQKIMECPYIYMHGPEHHVMVGAALLTAWHNGGGQIDFPAALEEMKKAGKIRYVGLSNFAQADVDKMMEYTDVHCQQSLYNMLERNPVSYHSIPLDYLTEKEVLPNVKKHGQAFLPYSPLFQGLLAGKFNSGVNFSEHDIRNANPKLVGPDFEKYFNAAKQLKDLADKYNKPMNEIALNWLRQKEEVTSIIGGASSVKQLENNIHCTTWDIDDEMMKEIEIIIEPFENL